MRILSASVGSYHQRCYKHGLLCSLHRIIECEYSLMHDLGSTLATVGKLANVFSALIVSVCCFVGGDIAVARTYYNHNKEYCGDNNSGLGHKAGFFGY